MRLISLLFLASCLCFCHGVREAPPLQKFEPIDTTPALSKADYDTMIEKILAYLNKMHDRHPIAKSLAVKIRKAETDEERRAFLYLLMLKLWAPKNRNKIRRMMKSSKLRPGSLIPGALIPGALRPGAFRLGALRPGGIETGSIETGSIETGRIETGSIETGSIETGRIETGSIETDYRVPDFPQCLELERCNGQGECQSRIDGLYMTEEEICACFEGFTGSTCSDPVVIEEPKHFELSSSPGRSLAVFLPIHLGILLL